MKNRFEQSNVLRLFREFDNVKRERRRRSRRKIYAAFAIFLFGLACGWMGSLVYAAWTLWHMVGGAR